MTASYCDTSREKGWSESMLIRGLWTLCDDGIVRPVIEGEVLSADGSWLRVELLVDVGADRTVFSAAVLATLALPLLPAPNQLGGVGGVASTVAVATHIRLSLGGGSTIAFQSAFAGFTQADALDMCVLGRDVTSGRAGNRRRARTIPARYCFPRRRHTSLQRSYNSLDQHN
jgi:hypothetical protein